jgi:hypothetical protein
VEEDFPGGLVLVSFGSSLTTKAMPMDLVMVTDYNL